MSSTKKPSMKINLTHDIMIDGVKYSAGTQEVPTEKAEDLLRMDKDYSAHVANRNRKNVYEKNMGSLAGGGE